MSRIHFTRIYGENYNSLGKFELKIEPGKHLIVGENSTVLAGSSNGSGKSSLMESIPYTLYKLYLRGTDPSRDKKGDCHTGVELRCGDDELVIERYHKHRKFKNTATLAVNGKEVTDRVSGSVDEQIQKAVNYPQDLFICTSVVMQGLPINFSQMTPAIRKGIFEDAIGCSVWDNYKKQVEEYRDTLDESFQSLISRKDKIERKIESLESNLETLQGASTGEAGRIESQIKECKVQLKKHAADRDAAQLKLDKAVEKSGDRQTLFDRRRTLSNKATLLNARLRDLKEIIDEKTCPTCGSKYPESRIKDAKAELESGHIELEGCQQELKQKDEAYDRLIAASDAVKLAASRREGLKNEITRLNVQLAEAQTGHDDEARELAKQLKALTKDKAAIDQEGEALEAKLSHANYVYELLLPSSQFRTQVLVDYLDRMSEVLGKVSPLVFPGVHVRLAVNSKATGIDLLIEREGETIDYKALSGGEKRRVDVAIILAFQRFLIEVTGVSTNLVVFDEIMDNVDSKGVDAILQCIDMLFTDDMAVYIISHNNDLKQRFDSVIRVIKRDGISRVAQ